MFVDNIDVKIGRILFENKTGKELYDVACGLRKIFDDSEKKDKQAGTMAVEVAVAAYFEGYKRGAALASFCMLAGTGYKNMDNLRIPYEVFTELGSEVNYDCTYNMGVEYEKGYPPYVTANPYIASLWYKKAADAGSARAQFEMGNRYYDGTGVEIDFQLTEYYWEAAAKQGYTSAQYNLGCLCDGSLSGGPSMTCFNPEKAGYWLEQAARGGHKGAAEVLNQSYRFNQRKNKWQKID